MYDYPNSVGLGLFGHRLVSLFDHYDGRFHHPAANHGWAANASANATQLASTLWPNFQPQYAAVTLAAVMMWAPATPQEQDWPILLLGLLSESAHARTDGCRVGNSSAAASLLNFTRAQAAVATNFALPSCPLSGAQSCAFLSYAHGRPLVATAQGPFYSAWDAAE